MAEETDKKSRTNYILEQVKLGKKKTEVLHEMQNVIFKGTSRQQLEWDWSDSGAGSFITNKIQSQALTTEMTLEEHIAARLKLYGEALNDRQHNIVLDLLKDIAKLQGHYVERQDTTTRIEFVFKGFESMDQGYVPKLVKTDYTAVAAIDVKGTEVLE